MVKVEDEDRLESWLREACCPNGSDAVTDPLRADSLRWAWDIVQAHTACFNGLY